VQLMEEHEGGAALELEEAKTYYQQLEKAS
jgi:hypothetical protein